MGSGQAVNKNKDEKSSKSVPSSVQFVDSLIAFLLCISFPVIPSYLPPAHFLQSFVFVERLGCNEGETQWLAKLPLTLPHSCHSICLISASCRQILCVFLVKITSPSTTVSPKMFLPLHSSIYTAFNPLPTPGKYSALT